MEDFDWRYYINRYADLRDAGVVNKKRAFVHWNKIGKYENRFPNKRVEEFINNKKKQEIINNNNQYYQNNLKNDYQNKNESFKEESSFSSFDNYPISLNEIKNIYSNANMEFTRSSEQSSDFQSINNNLLQENNKKIDLLLNNLKVIHNDLIFIKKKVHNLEINNDKYNNSIDANMSSFESIKNSMSKNEKIKSNKENKNVGINQKVVSSDDYSDVEESECNEIKYSNSDEYLPNNGNDNDIIEGNFKNLNFHSSIKIENENKIAIDKLDKVSKSKNLKKQDTNIDTLIKNININDKVVKKKNNKKMVSLNQDESLEESSDDQKEQQDNLKEIENIEHKSILNKILNNKDLDKDENKNNTILQKMMDDNKSVDDKSNKSQNSIVSYLNNQNGLEDELVSFDNKKINKLIENISSKKI